MEIRQEFIKQAKLQTVHTITNEYRCTEGAAKAQEEFINIVSNEGIPEDIPSVKIENETILQAGKRKFAKLEL